MLASSLNIPYAHTLLQVKVIHMSLEQFWWQSCTRHGDGRKLLKPDQISNETLKEANNSQGDGALDSAP